MVVKRRNRAMTYAKRNWKIYNQRKSGRTFRDIAQEHSLDERRIRAIVKQCETILKRGRK